MVSQINLHAFLERSQANGPGTRAVVWVQGCPRHCPGCWNPGSLPFTTRELVTVEDLESRILAIQGINGVTFSGGEPFSQAAPLSELARRLRERGFTVVVFTGFTLDHLRKGNRPEWNALLAETDLLIDGEYKQELRTDLSLRGSANQNIYYLSGRIRPEEVAERPQLAEATLSLDGQITETGFPQLSGMDAVLEELRELFPSAAAGGGGKNEKK